MRYLIAFLLLCSPAFGQRTYDIVAVRSPLGQIPEVLRPTSIEPGTDLVLIHPDGSIDTLVAGGNGACTDPSVSLDGKSIYFAKFMDVRSTSLNTQRQMLPDYGADIWRIDLATKTQTQLTHVEWTPLTSWPWASDPLNSAKQTGVYSLGTGIYNLCPIETPGGRIVFCSSRNGYLAPDMVLEPNLQLYSMDLDGRNLEQIGHLNIGSALHPALLTSGEIVFSSAESQGRRDHRNWSLWRIWPDGRNWGPQLAFSAQTAFHFVSQLSDGRIAAAAYYNGNDFGFGEIFAFQPAAPTGQPGFGSLFPAQNPALPHVAAATGQLGSGTTQIAFSPPGIESLTPWSTFHDVNSFKRADGTYFGKATHPAAAPGGDMLLSYSPTATGGTAPNRPGAAVHSQIAIMAGGKATDDSNTLEIVATDDQHNYFLAKAIAPWSEIYGHAPVELPCYANDGTASAALPKGTPFCIVGTSSLYKRDSRPPGAINAVDGAGNQINWVEQGSDAGVYDNSEIEYVRIIQLEPRPYLSYGPGVTNGNNHTQGWTSPINERQRILAEIAVRKPDGNGVEPLDPDGNPDTSFAVKIPADTPFTFQVLDKNHMVLTQAQTWHQGRPGEKRVDCGGCHAHSQLPTDFEKTLAARPEYNLQTFDTVRDVEFFRDVKPILDKHCTTCHDASNPSGYDLSGADQVTPTRARSQLLSARQSLLIAKIYGKWLDGSGKILAGEQMPPASAADTLTDSEKQTIATWIDLGCGSGSGLFHDDLKPTLTVQSPARTQAGLTEFRLGAADCNSGLDAMSVSVKCSQTVNGQAAGGELAGLFATDGSIWSLPLDAATQAALTSGDLTVSVKDKAGNVQSVVRSFSVTAPTQPTIQQLQQQIADLQAQVTQLQSQLDDNAKRFQAIKAELP